MNFSSFPIPNLLGLDGFQSLLPILRGVWVFYLERIVCTCVCVCVGKVFNPVYSCLGLPRWLSGKESTCHAGDMGSIWVRKIPWRKKWQSALEFLPGKSHGQRSLACYSPQSRRVGHDLAIKLTLTHTLFFSFSLSLLFLISISHQFVCSLNLLQGDRRGQKWVVGGFPEWPHFFPLLCHLWSPPALNKKAVFPPVLICL